MDIAPARAARRFPVALALALGLLIGPVATANAAAEGDTRPCVTRGEWRTVYMSPDGQDNGPGTGGTHARVHRVFDSWGKRVRFRDFGDFAYQIRRYTRCGSARHYRVTYHKYDGYPRWHSYWG